MEMCPTTQVLAVGPAVGRGPIRLHHPGRRTGKLEPDTAQYTELDSAVALHARIGRTQPFPDRPDNDERIAAVLGPAHEVQEPIAGRTHQGRITDTRGSGIRANAPAVGGLGWSSRGRPPPGWRASPRHEAVAATVERPGSPQ